VSHCASKWTANRLLREVHRRSSMVSTLIMPVDIQRKTRSIPPTQGTPPVALHRGGFEEHTLVVLTTGA
jgi:hypothetical protein